MTGILNYNLFNEYDHSSSIQNNLYVFQIKILKRNPTSTTGFQEHLFPPWYPGIRLKTNKQINFNLRSTI